CRGEPPPEVFWITKVLADQFRAEDLPVLHDQTAVGLPGKRDLRNAGDHQWVNHAYQDREDHGGDNRYGKLLDEHKRSLFLDQVQHGQNHVDDLDPDERHDQPAHAVYEQVITQQRGRAYWAVAHAAQRQRDQEDDDQRVEDHRRKDGAIRRAQAHD